MSNLNDNNLDDLLRRAAEKYPLRTDSANFAKVVADLEKDPSLILPPLNNEDRRRRRRFIWLFLLLPLGGGAYFAWHAAAGRAHTTPVLAGKTGNGEVGKAENGEAGKVQDAGVGREENGGTAKTGNGEAGKGKNGEVVGKTENKEAGKAENKEVGKVENKEVGKAGNGNVVKLADEGAGRRKDGKVVKVESGVIKEGGNRGAGRTGHGEAGRTESKGDGKGENGEVAGRTESKGFRKGENGDVVGKTENKEIGRVGNGKVGKIENGNGEVGRVGNRGAEKAEDKEVGKGGALENESAVTNEKVIKERATNENFSAVPARQVDGKLSLASTRGAVNVNIPVKGKATAATQSNAPQKDKIKLQKPKPSFYVGVLGSPDLSTIKMQSVKSVGYNLGVLLGYSFNSRWAIETGLYYDRKKYYTDGEYFSKEKLPSWFSNYYVKTVDGFCNMWEIPLNVRYNFSRGDKINWFATAGFSNYLMTGETYTFTGSSSTNPNWHQTWPYKTPYKYWFSILSFSAGFEQRLGKIGNLRLEPFVRVPLGGIGTGNLSIMSAGLNIGITRRIW